MVGELQGQKLYQYTAIDEFSRLRYLEGFQEASTYSSAVFLKNAAAFFKKYGFGIECVQTDNGSEFTRRSEWSFRQPEHQINSFFYERLIATQTS